MQRSQGLAAAALALGGSCRAVNDLQSAVMAGARQHPVEEDLLLAGGQKDLGMTTRCCICSDMAPCQRKHRNLNPTGWQRGQSATGGLMASCSGGVLMGSSELCWSLL